METDFKIGQRVSHATYGDGTIIDLEGKLEAIKAVEEMLAGQNGNSGAVVTVTKVGRGGTVTGVAMGGK